MERPVPFGFPPGKPIFPFKWKALQISDELGENIDYQCLSVSLVVNLAPKFRKTKFKMLTDEEIQREFEEFSVSIDDLTVLDKCR